MLWIQGPVFVQHPNDVTLQMTTKLKEPCSLHIFHGLKLRPYHKSQQQRKESQWEKKKNQDRRSICYHEVIISRIKFRINFLRSILIYTVQIKMSTYIIKGF